MRIGFIGLGIMGEPMSTNILKKSGYPLMVYDINADKMKKICSLGAERATNIKEITDNCDVVFSMLPKNEHVKDVYRELIINARKGHVFVDMSTISPRVSAELSIKVAEKGAIMLDAPVVKSKPAAITGDLGIYVGGDIQAYEKVKPLLECMGRNIIHLGENGTGLIMKLCHNMLVAQIQNGVNETLTLAKKAGKIDVDSFVEAVSYGGAQNFYLDSKANAIKNMDFTTAFAVDYMNKDVFLVKDLCDELGIDLMGVNAVTKRYSEAMKRGFAKEDYSATYKLFE